MNNQQYIAVLKKALSGLDKGSREDIVQEIQSHASESGDTLSERFGSPEELAKQYLDGVKVATPIGQKIWGISKKVFIGIGMAVVGLFALVALISWWWSRDAFDYADLNAPELKVNQTDWKTLPWQGPLDIEVAEASLVFYWHDKATILSDCDGKYPLQVQGSVVRFKYASCRVYLPRTPTTMLANQASIVLVKPQASIEIGLNRTAMRLAENGEKYQYSIDTTRSDVDYFNSSADAEYTLKISGQESSVSAYQY